MILNIDPHLRMGRKDEALLQEKFLDGIEKAEQEVAKTNTFLAGFSSISFGPQKVKILDFCRFSFLAVQDSSIGDIVSQ